MKEALIANWNECVGPEDLGIFVGDIFFYHNMKEMRETISRMNGKKILVRGNHDQKPIQMLRAGFDLCVDRMSISIGNEIVDICHYPFQMPRWKYKLIVYKNKFIRLITRKNRRICPQKYYDRRPENRGQFLIHGHSHSPNKLRGRAIHVGVDAWNYKPINISQIESMIHQVKNDERSRRDKRNPRK